MRSVGQVDVGQVDVGPVDVGQVDVGPADEECLPGGVGGSRAAAELLLRALVLDPPLTETEERILGLLRGGPTNAEIATCLGITTRTVKFHVANLRVKHCGLSRLQLCLLATLRRLDPVAAGSAVGRPA
ncbi:helix-turn-helix transcriptional regulator [Streptomyces sp. NPDC049813]|uniref:helix-turn-helix transcriptional regulator n=1 Tax=Streptomyces sp. NPDC049813 TaxID=3365597 RepID=UPI0037876ED1